MSIGQIDLLILLHFFVHIPMLDYAYVFLEHCIFSINSLHLSLLIRFKIITLSSR